MNRRLAAVVLATSLGFGPFVVPAAADGPPPRSITVVGVGREDGPPDTARLQFGVEHTAPSAKAAAEASAKSAAGLLDVLKKQAGEGAQVTTGGYQLYPVYEQVDRLPPGRPQQPKVVGYTASQDVIVETRRVDAVGTLIDAAAAGGSARIGGLTFSIADPGPLVGRALANAASDAASQAAAIAGAFKVRLVEILEATTESGGLPRPERYAKTMAADAIMATPIEPGTVTIETRLRVTYRIE